ELHWSLCELGWRILDWGEGQGLAAISHGGLMVKPAQLLEWVHKPHALSSRVSRPATELPSPPSLPVPDRFGVIFITGNSFAVSPFFSLQNSEGVCDKTEILVVGAAQAGGL